MRSWKFCIGFYRCFLLAVLLLFNSIALGQKKGDTVGRVKGDKASVSDASSGAPDGEEAGLRKKYFSDGAGRRPAVSSGSRLLALHFGSFVNSKAFVWGGDSSVSKIGRENFGLTYKIGEWTNSMDLHMRVDWSEFKVEGQRAAKISFLPLVTFPDVAADFPLYFGAGIGVGAFVQQIRKESSLSFDYQLLIGARLLNVFGRAGFFLETGIKDHLHVLSDGQFNGQFLTLGAVFEI